ncbi:type II toxin-antitoxin system RelE/ParE family toxin [Sphingomonas koreensis]|nr:type II toxin-antitoxin system RelE/ParE family toxin [Sphingomonas koreensis]
MRIVYLPRANDDLFEIFLNIAIENEPAANRLIDRLRVAILRLRDYPMSAPPRDDIAPGIRGLSVGGYVVLHRIGDSVEIVRIIHGARHLPEIDLQPDRP